ncbi:MAG TPA: DUF1800 family protein [Bryobacteraceae bacterium]|jgi:uncharacterized protein (DUF1800 family)
MKNLLPRCAALAAALILSSAAILDNAALAQARPVAAATPQVTPMAAARFLEQAGFGPTQTSVSQVQALGFSAWIDAQIALDSTQWSAIPDPSFNAKGNASLTPAQAAFFMNAVNGPDQLRQRVALALSEIWVVSGVKLDPQAIVPYLRLLQADAFVTYDKLMYDVTVSPAMGHYLDMVNNNKASAGHSPDENYAREAMQLFTIGLDQLDAYGRVIRDSTGSTIPTFDQDVVEGFSAAYTGWTYAPAVGAAKSKFPNPANWTAPMVAFEANHDTHPKQLLNGYIMPAGQTAEEDLQGALANLFTHTNIGPFVCRQLIQHLVTSDPSDAYVYRVTNVFNQSPRGNLAAVVKAILLDPEARQGDDGTENAATKLREPVLWIPTFLRGLNATVTSTNNLTGQATNLGQQLYYSPSVFNYFSPGYRINVSDTQSANAPEFQLLSEATAAATADLVNTFAYGSVGGVTIDLSPYTAILGTKPKAAEIGTMVDQLNTNLMGGRMPTTMRQSIILAAEGAATPKAMVQSAVYLIGSSWNYQVER